MDSPSLILTAQVIGIAAPFACAGYQYCAAINIVPRLYSEPARISTPIFKHVFQTGSAHIIPLAAVATASHVFLAWRDAAPSSSLSPARIGYLGAATATLATGGFTATVMAGGIKRLLAIADSATLQEKATASGEHVALLKTWAAQSVFRMALFAGGGVAALWATLAHS